MAVKFFHRDCLDSPLVILDIMMPQMDGYEVCRWLKTKEKNHKPAVLMYLLTPFPPRNYLAHIYLCALCVLDWFVQKIGILQAGRE